MVLSIENDYHEITGEVFGGKSKCGGAVVPKVQEERIKNDTSSAGNHHGVE
jgi:hypothetical protein